MNKRASDCGERVSETVSEFANGLLISRIIKATKFVYFEWVKLLDWTESHLSTPSNSLTRRLNLTLSFAPLQAAKNLKF